MSSGSDEVLAMSSGPDEVLKADEVVVAIGRAGTEMVGMAQGLNNIHKLQIGSAGGLSLSRFAGTAVQFKIHVLPKSVDTIATLKDILEYYTTLDFNDWLECLPLLRTEAEKSHMLSRDIANEYNFLLQHIDSDIAEVGSAIDKAKATELSLRQSETTLRQQVFGNLSDARAAGGLQALAAAGVVGTLMVNPITWGAGVLALSAMGAGAFGVGQLARAECDEDAVSRQSAANAKKRDADSTRQMVKYLEDDFIQNLRKFNATMQAIAGFFENMMADIILFSKGINAGELTRALTDGETKKARMHYLKLKGKARLIHGSCSTFIAAVPAMKSAMRGVPDFPNDGEEVQIQYLR